jgi:hypothetical protein
MENIMERKELSKLSGFCTGYSTPTIVELEEIIMGKAVTDAAGRAAVEEIYSLIRKRDTQEAPVPEWTAVTERLPRVGEAVLCLWNDGSDVMVVDTLEQRSARDGAGVQFVKNYTHNYSHWCPLPHLPVTAGGAPDVS